LRAYIEVFSMSENSPFPGHYDATRALLEHGPQLPSIQHATTYGFMTEIVAWLAEQGLDAGARLVKVDELAHDDWTATERGGNTTLVVDFDGRDVRLVVSDDSDKLDTRINLSVFVEP
jgi:hypothetical protein